MALKTICEPDEDLVPASTAEIEAFEGKHSLKLPETLHQILTETNGGYVRDEYLLFEGDGDEVIAGVEELNGVLPDEVDWASSIVPLPRWVAFKNELNPSLPNVEALEKLNGDISRYFVISNRSAVFYLLDYTDSKVCKRICYLDLVGGDQVITHLGDDLSCVIAI